MRTELVWALAAIMAMLFIMISSLFASAPMLFMKHDSTEHSRVVRGFFNTYYWVVFVSAIGVAVSFANVGQVLLSSAGAALAVAAFVLRLVVVPRMDSLHAQLKAGTTSAIPTFRRWHVFAVLVNLGLLAALFAALVKAPFDLK